MKKYKVACEVLKVPGGVVQLADSQVKTRADCLTDLGRNRYEVMKPVEFKKGDVLGLAESTHKYASNALELIDGDAKTKTKAPPVDIDDSCDGSAESKQS